MNKKEMAAKLAKKTGLSQAKALEVLTAIFSVRAIVNICCSPPLMRPPIRPRISPRFVNSVNSLSRVHCGAFGLGG